ncbi:hypothetical protein AX16_006587 [Volvariella volvacea WC 439]|nr:hypothetical protein AX16_006587 [Volvariella volvacea WC 439]
MLRASSSSRTCRALIPRHYARQLTARTRRSVSTVPSDTAHEDCDVVIVGGGPAGLALASALGSSQIVKDNLKVVLVEGGDLSKIKNWSPSSYSNRVSSLTSASQAFLQDIGAWDHVELARTAPVEEMQIWDGITDARITFSAGELNLPNPQLGMARLTENLNLQRGLLRHIEGLSNIELVDKTRVQCIERDEDRGNWPLVFLDNQRVLRPRLLIGADGFNSPVRSYARIPSFGWSYDTQAIVATLVHPPRGAFEPPNTVAYQRFLPTGPIAFLPLSPTVSSLVWSTRPALASAVLASEPGVLASMINAAFRLPDISLRYLHNRILDAHAKGTPITPSEIHEEILWREQSHAIDTHSAYASAARLTATEGGELSLTTQSGIPPTDSECLPPLVTSIQPGTMASFPLRYNHTESYIGEGHGARTVLVGDAAHTIHPLAGQGLNLGLADVECLARTIETAVSQGSDIGSYTALLPYSSERYFKNHTMMSAIDKLHKIYTTTAEPIVWARSVGVEVLNELDTIKAAVMLSAGAQPSTGQQQSSRPDAGLWQLAAKGVEGAVALNQAVGIAKQGIMGLVGVGLESLLKNINAQSGAGRNGNGGQ